MHQFFKTELQSQTEEQKYDSDLGENFDILPIGDSWKKVKVWANKKSCDDITQNKWLLDLSKNDCRYRSSDQYQSKILD